MARNTLEILFLCEEEVEQCISYKEAITAAEEAYRKIATKQVSQFRSKFVEAGEGSLSIVGGCAEGGQSMTLVATLNFDNPVKYGLKSSSGLCTLYDPKTGFPVCVMSAHNYIKQINAACASAVTAKYLAKKDSSKIAIIGTGYQGVSHFLAMKELFHLEEVRVFDISKEVQAGFVENMSKYGIKITPQNSVEEATRGSDIVLTLTTADAPLVKKDWIEEGMLLIKVGSYQELEPEVIKIADKLVTDDWEYTILARSKEIRILREQGLISEDALREREFLYAELPEIVAGRKKGRENQTERIISIQVGVAATYLLLTPFVYNSAVERGIGQKLNLLSRGG